MALVISIGKNLAGSDEMLPAEWIRFQGDLTALLTLAKAKILFEGEGLGIDQNNVIEKSFTVIAEDLRETQRQFVLSGLTYLATAYFQDSIAFTQGTTQLIKSREVIQ